jgi:light-regulated signal transduction histidine kinase (bacteriophytochrome)
MSFVSPTDLADPEETIRLLQEELAETNREVLALTLELEKRVEQRTAELAAANKELEAFSYSVSHDLRAPLRHIDGFAQILRERYCGQLPPAAQGLLEKVCTSAQHLGQLIDELLNFSRLGRQPLTKRTVNLSSLVQQVIDELQSEREGRQVEIRVSELPDCLGDVTLLKQVIFNLVSNALKFTRKREQAVIEIGYYKEPKELVVFVSDNGAGFDMAYAQKLFGVFQRLHSADQFEGTGVGLSIVQRVIHRHGGRVWAKGDVNKGATFYFTLPY